MITGGFHTVGISQLLKQRNVPHLVITPNVTMDTKLSDEVYTQAFSLVQQEHGKKFILSGGCEITVNTPPENLAALVKAAHY